MKHFSGVETKDMKSNTISAVEKMPDNIALHTGTNNLKKNTPEEIAMEILELVVTCKTDKNNVLISGIDPRSD